MSESNEIKNFEATYKKPIFDKINHLCISQSKYLSNIRISEKSLDLTRELEFPNIGITLNNKLIEFMHIFQDAGLSMFAQRFENYGSKKISFVSSSFVGDSIIFYMLSQVSSAIDILVKYQSKLNELIDVEEEKYAKLQNASRLKKLSFSIRSLVSLPEELLFSYTDEDVDELNSYISAYIGADNQLCDSDLRNIIIPSLVKHIKDHRYSKATVSNILNESVITDLSKLGLSDLIPELNQEVNKIFNPIEEEIHTKPEEQEK